MALKNKGLGRGLSELLGINELDVVDTKNTTATDIGNADDLPSMATMQTAASNAANTQQTEQSSSANTVLKKLDEAAMRMPAPERSLDGNNRVIAVNIDLKDIDPNYEQPRKSFDEDALNELADSIRQHGVIQPIVVVRMGMRFMIITGERRFRASKIAGKTSIPAIIRNYTPQQIREISLIENLQREDLNPVEAARAIKQLMEEFGLTQETAADRIGKSRSAIANTLRLLSLDEKVLDLIQAGRLSAGHGRALVVIEDKGEQLNLALKAADNKMSVREIEKKVREYLNPKPVAELIRKQEISLELKDLVTNMQRAFATKVTAIGNDHKGRICVDYYTKDDLDRICALIRDWQMSNM